MSATGPNVFDRTLQTTNIRLNEITARAEFRGPAESIPRPPDDASNVQCWIW